MAEDELQAFLELRACLERIYPDPKVRKYVLRILHQQSSVNRDAYQLGKVYIFQGVGSNGKSVMNMLIKSNYESLEIGTNVLGISTAHCKTVDGVLKNLPSKEYIYCENADNSTYPINSHILDLITRTHDIFLFCNDLPPLKHIDKCTYLWDRIEVIPHTSIFKQANDPSINKDIHIYQQDTSIMSRVSGDWIKSFRNLLHVYRSYYTPKVPECILEATLRYKNR